MYLAAAMIQDKGEQIPVFVIIGYLSHNDFLFCYGYYTTIAFSRQNITHGDHGEKITVYNRDCRPICKKVMD